MQAMSEATPKPTPKPTPKSIRQPRRRYSSPLRAAQADRTRAQVLAAAATCFEESGWAGTTVAAIAERAGVAVETIYSAFGSKKAVLRQVIDVAVVGDSEPVPLAEREVFTRLSEGARDARIDAGIEMLTDIHGRLAKVWRTVGEAAASDPEIDGWRVHWDEGRRVDTRRSMELILGEPIDDVTLDLLWGILSHEFYAMLVFDRGLDRGQYVERVHEAVIRLVAR
jgi:AcrR family transcriptional regulator